MCYALSSKRKDTIFLYNVVFQTRFICVNFPFLHRVHYRDLTVNVGMHDRLDTSFQVLRVTNGVKHPAFTSNAVRDINDIAILTLNKKLHFSDKVHPICLPTAGKKHICCYYLR